MLSHALLAGSVAAEEMQGDLAEIFAAHAVAGVGEMGDVPALDAVRHQQEATRLGRSRAAVGTVFRGKT